MKSTWFFVGVVSVACGTETEPATAPPLACSPPNRVVGDRCLEPGVQDNGCAAGTLGLGDGRCRPAGVDPERCAEGFVAEGDGCKPILPAGPCAAGSMAVPGDTECRAVMSCGTGKWGDIAVDATTVYVDASYASTDSDGSASKPWTTISDAVNVAASGALIAVAAGSYSEDVVVVGKGVRLRGVCPADVEIVGATALTIGQGAHGSEVHGLALRGDAMGLRISGATDVSVEAVWAHGGAGRGLVVDSTFGPASASVRASLVEQNRAGILVANAEAALEAVAVRDNFGRGVSVQLGCAGSFCDPAARANVELRGSLVEDNQEGGVVVTGSDVTIDGLVIRGTLPSATDQLFGSGLVVQRWCTATACDPASGSTALVKGTLIEGNHELGVLVAGSEVALDGVTVRETLPRASDQRMGRGIVIGLACSGSGLVCDPLSRSSATVVGSLVAGNRDWGVLVMGSDATLEGMLVRGTLPRASDSRFGDGIGISVFCSETDCNPATRASAELRGSLVEDNHDIGINVGSSDATLDGVLVRRTSPQASDARFGRGIDIHVTCDGNLCDPNTRSIAEVRGSLVEDNHDVGIDVAGSDATLYGVLVRGTRPLQTTGRFGDGIDVWNPNVAANAVLTSSRIDANARVGVGNFGASVALGASALTCNGIDLEGEGQPFTFDDRGDLRCGCPDATSVCVAQSAGIQSPDPITNAD